MDKPHKKKINAQGVSYDKLLMLSLNVYGSFYPKLYLLETTLKKRLFEVVKNKLGEDWFNIRINSPVNNSVFKTEADNILRRKPKGFALKDKGFLVESGLGIWVEFFNRALYKEMKGVPIAIFYELPPNIKRKELYQKLNSVKEMRNQLVHNRLLPITEPQHLQIIERLLEANKDLTDLLQWLGFSKSQLDSRKFEKGIAAIKKALR
jgi:hypothetical protein